MTHVKGRFGVYDGQYIPETLMNAVIEPGKVYNHSRTDLKFQQQLKSLLNKYAERRGCFFA